MNLARMLALALIPLLSFPQPAAASWAIVQDIPPGTRINIRTRDDTEPKGYDIVKGHFESATEDSIAFRTKRKRESLVLAKSLVQEIKVRIPIRNRRRGLLISGGTGAFMFGIFPTGALPGTGTVSTWGDDIPQFFIALGIGVTVGVSILALRWGSMKTIYPVSTVKLRKIQPPEKKKLARPPRTTKVPRTAPNTN